jgi:hypothetical protein
MLRFAVFDADGPARAWPLVGAHLLGPEDLPVPGDVEFKKGHVVCRKQGNQTVSLCLQYDAGSVGTLMLQTCLLPERERPYTLAVELARHRIKSFLTKSEEWQILDLDGGHPAVAAWEKARQIFTQSLTTPDPLGRDRAARKALTLGIEATERLALTHAEILLHRRFGQRPASSTTLGVRVCPDRDTPALKQLVGKDFDLLMVPLTWRRLEVEEGKYDWDPVDRWIDWARSQGKPVVAGPLLDFSKQALPKWMYVWQHDYDTCRDLAYDHVERVVERYRSSVGMWNLASGINLNDNFQFSSEQMIDLVRMASLLVRHGGRAGRSMVEVVQPFGEDGARHAGAVPPITFIDRLVQEGIRIDAVGVQLLFGSSRRGRAARDLMQISSALDRYFFLELPVIVSAAGVPSATIDELGGWWLDRWSPQIQAKWSSRAFVIAMSKPYVESFFWADLYDHRRADVAAAALIDEQGRTKPVLQKLTAVRKRLRKPLGALKDSLSTSPQSPL